MKQFFSVFLLVIISNCFSQKKSIFHDNQGEIQTLVVDNYFQSLSKEMIQEIKKINPNQGEFLHLVTDKKRFYFLSDISQLIPPQKNKFYKKLFDSGFSFQIEHGLPSGYVWIFFSKDKYNSEDGLQLITNLFEQTIN